MKPVDQIMLQFRKLPIDQQKTLHHLITQSVENKAIARISTLTPAEINQMAQDLEMSVAEVKDAIASLNRA